MKKNLLVFMAIAASVFIARLASANGLGGQRLEKTAGQYVVDIGTDQEFTPIAGAPVRFDFNLLKADRTGVPYTDVEVYITQNGAPLVDSDIATARSGPTLLTFTFPTNGSYNMETTFYDKDNRIADAIFPLTISGSATPSNSGGGSTGGGRYIAFGILIGVVFGAFAEIVFRKKNAR